MPIRSNPVKEKLAAGGEAYGTMLFEFLSPGLPQIAANSGADFLFYDMEHSGFDFEQIKMQCALCRGLGIVPMVRPPAKQYQFARAAAGYWRDGAALPDGRNRRRS